MDVFEGLGVFQDTPIFVMSRYSVLFREDGKIIEYKDRCGICGQFTQRLWLWSLQAGFCDVCYHHALFANFRKYPESEHNVIYVEFPLSERGAVLSDGGRIHELYMNTRGEVLSAVGG